MARIEDLLTKIDDPALRADLEREVAVLKEHVDFGLVFERHIPETVDLLYVEPAVGDLVRMRREDGDALYRVFELSDGSATLTPLDSGETIEAALDDLLVVKPFGEPVYPALTPLESVFRSEERPFHAVINGENLHVVQLLLYLYEGKVDCLYLDPPYNSGATDWKYNNRYVDAIDRYRHSKWLSMMERRLRLARRLLKPDGVLIVTIDENEVYHLGVLLEELFREYLRYQVTIVINPKGTAKVNFARVEEYALFLVPDTGSDVILHLPPPEDEAPEEEWDSEEEDGDEPEERAIEAGVDPTLVRDRVETLKAERDELQAALAELDDAARTDTAIDLDDACEILDSLPNLTEALALADPELRRRVFDAFRLAVALDRNAGQIRVKALISSAFTKSRDLQNLVANGAIAGAGFEPATSGL